MRPEVASDIISGVDAKQAGMNVRVKFGDFRSNRSYFVTNDAGGRRSSDDGVLPKNKWVHCVPQCPYLIFGVKSRQTMTEYVCEKFKLSWMRNGEND